MAQKILVLLRKRRLAESNILAIILWRSMNKFLCLILRRVLLMETFTESCIRPKYSEKLGRENMQLQFKIAHSTYDLMVCLACYSHFTYSSLPLLKFAFNPCLSFHHFWLCCVIWITDTVFKPYKRYNGKKNKKKIKTTAAMNTNISRPFHFAYIHVFNHSISVNNMGAHQDFNIAFNIFFRFSFRQMNCKWQRSLE